MIPITVPLGDLYAKTQSVNPTRHADEAFELYSVPSYEARQPDLITGAKIGSTKVAVLPGDVLLCKIVPHIRRAWVVPPRGSIRQIGSGEWIVLRDARFHPDYLRHLVLSNSFHALFMSTVAGVGGSLMRARPAHAGVISIRLPPLPEQRRIAAILDQADELRTKRRRALTLLDELADSIFIDMFGGAVDRGEISNLRLDELTDADDRINYGVVQPGDGVADGVPLIRVGDMRLGGINDANLKTISTEIEKSYARSRIRGTEILVSCVGSIGEVSIVEANHIGHNVARAVARVPLSSPEHRTYVAAALRSSTVQAYFVNEARTVSQPTLNIKQLAATPIPWPMETDLATFHRRVSELEAVQNANREQATQLDELFSSLQHRAFQGEL